MQTFVYKENTAGWVFGSQLLTFYVFNVPIHFLKKAFVAFSELKAVISALVSKPVF